MLLPLLVCSCPCIFCSIFTAFKHLSFHAFACSGFPSRLILLHSGPYATFLVLLQTALSHPAHTQAIHELKQPEALTLFHPKQAAIHPLPPLELPAGCWPTPQTLGTSSLQSSCPGCPSARSWDMGNVETLPKPGDEGSSGKPLSQWRCSIGMGTLPVPEVGRKP